MAPIKETYSRSGSNKMNTLCESCQLDKLSKFPFSSSKSVSSVLFDKIHYDLWGPAPTFSIGKFLYYACFVDDYSKYCWLTSLCLKSDFLADFLAFESCVLRQFTRKIKVFHSDEGGKFANSILKSHF
jgi:hypothetical protein